MKGEQRKMMALLHEGTSVKFSIPVYQRNYSWSIKQCKQLFDDLVMVQNENRHSHFFGSIVSIINHNSNKNEYSIIDGQQRLTTISLLLLAIYNQLDRGNIETSDKRLKEKIWYEHLVDRYDDNMATAIKLKVAKDDALAYANLFNKDEEDVLSSNVTINYNYFYDRILEDDITVDELFDSIEKLEIIDIRLDPEKDDPQLIFESLNSTGLALEEGDKVRNYILMDAKISDQEELYNKYWSKIELLVDNNLTMFIRDYLSAKTRATPAISKVYQSFKDYSQKTDITKELLLKDMLSYARNYYVLLTGDYDDEKIRAAIIRLNRLETTVIRPFLLQVFMLVENGVIDRESLSNIFILIESYIFRRSVVGIPTNALNKIFLALNNDVYRLEGNYEDYFNKLSFVLLTKSGNQRFPLNDEFIDSFTGKDIYNSNRKNKIYILERFENYSTKEDKEIYDRIDSGVYSIEHIMPQTLNEEWKSELGEEYEAIYDKWLHRIANLTLTAYNSKYQNYSFNRKKHIENGFIDSGLRINQYIAHFDKWGEEELFVRNNHLMDQALNIWKEASTTYKVSVVEKLEVNLSDEDLDLKGYKVIGYQIDDESFDVDNLTRAYIDIIEWLYDIDSTIIVELARENNSYGLISRFDFDPYNLKSPEKLRDFYVEKNWNNNNKLRNLRELFEIYNIDPSRVTFVVDEEVEV